MVAVDAAVDVDAVDVAAVVIESDAVFVDATSQSNVLGEAYFDSTDIVVAVLVSMLGVRVLDAYSDDDDKLVFQF